jgi:hypothetical protein
MMETFRSSRPAVVELAGRYREIISQIRGSKEHKLIKGGDGSGGTGGDEKKEKEKEEEKEEEAERTLFVEMSEICLWGNATDLSLLTSLTYEDIQKLQGSEARRSSEKNVLVNDLGKAFEVLKRAEREPGKDNTRRVDIVLDNAGFELFVDLVLAGYLVAVGLATEVVLHPKSVPWFVSDVVPGDFANLLDVMRDPRGFYGKDSAEGTALTEQEVSDIRFLFDDWRGLHEDGKLILRPNGFWTHAGSFWRMPHVAPEVLEDLKESELVVFKGDLNYRKLTGDVCPLSPVPVPVPLCVLVLEGKKKKEADKVEILGCVATYDAVRGCDWAVGWCIVGTQGPGAADVQG